MRMPRPRMTVIGLMIAIAALALAAAVVEATGSAAYRQGAREARQELRDGTASIYTWGLFDFTENVDRETGLPYRAIAGCVVDDAIEDRARGHNEEIRRYIKLWGLPSNSLKPWEAELFDLRGYFESQEKAVQPAPLIAGGPAVRSSDGKYEVRLKVFEPGDGSPRSLRVSVRSGGRVCGETSILATAEDQPLLLWGSPGSGFAIIRSRSTGREWYTALGLERVEWLRVEWSRTGQLPGET